MREGICVARCTVERLMKKLGMQGIRRGKRCRTTIANDLLTCLSSRQSQSAICSHSSESAVGRGYYLCRNVDGVCLCGFYNRCFCPVSWSLRTDLVLDALEQALWARRKIEGLIHHSDHGCQYLSIRYTERLIEANIEASVGSVGGSYDNALAETVNGLYKTEVIRHRGPWRNIDDVEFATLEWGDWFNNHNRRLLEPIGNIPPAEFEMAILLSPTKGANQYGLTQDK